MTQTEPLIELDSRLRAMLPNLYRDSYERVQPVSMGSAALKYDSCGRVAWDRVWGSFCDLAMAGGPPHKGRLLEPGNALEVKEQAEAYQQVVGEIVRGVTLAAGLDCVAAQQPGWVAVECGSHGMAGWLGRAIVMENIAVRVEGPVIRLPAGPSFRIEKEVKNVVTSVAKTCHYWRGHMSSIQRRDIANRTALLNAQAPLLQPEEGVQTEWKQEIAGRVAAVTGLSVTPHSYGEWLGFECRAVTPAIWMMRALVVSNILARREETALFVPLNPRLDGDGSRLVAALSQVSRLARLKGVLSS